VERRDNDGLARSFSKTLKQMHRAYLERILA
jgi:hypothetical protein